MKLAKLEKERAIVQEAKDIKLAEKQMIEAAKLKEYNDSVQAKAIARAKVNQAKEEAKLAVEQAIARTKARKAELKLKVAKEKANIVQKNYSRLQKEEDKLDNKLTSTIKANKAKQEAYDKKSIDKKIIKEIEDSRIEVHKSVIKGEVSELNLITQSDANKRLKKIESEIKKLKKEINETNSEIKRSKKEERKIPAFNKKPDSNDLSIRTNAKRKVKGIRKANEQKQQEVSEKLYKELSAERAKAIQEEKEFRKKNAAIISSKKKNIKKQTSK